MEGPKMILLAFEVKNLALPACFTSFVSRLDSIYGLDAKNITNTKTPSFWFPRTEPLVGIFFFFAPPVELKLVKTRLHLHVQILADI